MRVDFPLLRLSKEKITQPIESFIELREHSIRYCVKFFADHLVDEEDESLGWVNEFVANDVIAEKKSITGFIKKWSLGSKVWKISIIISGFADNIDVFFKRESEATELFEKLDNYLHGD